MDEYTKCIVNIQLGGGDMKDDKGITLKEAIKLYYGEIDLTDTEKEEIDERLRKIEESGFLERCKEVARQKQEERKKKFVHIGRWCISKVACLIISVIIVGILGVGAYAAVRSNIKGIEVDKNGDHSEVNVDYNDGSKGEVLTVIDDYYRPLWVPEGFHIASESKRDRMYNIIYLSDDSNDRIHYSQSLSDVNFYYGAEDGKHEIISFENYSGEFIEDEDDNYLIVTDGTYVYSLIGNADKDTFIKMMQNMISDISS